MPELPDLVHVERVLGAAIVGRRVEEARTGDPTVLRVMVPERLPDTLRAHTLTAVERRGHFLRFAFDGELVLVVNAMLAGKYKLLPPDQAKREKDPVALGFALRFDDGGELRFIDDKRMGKVYLARAADEGTIPVYGALGVDLLSPAFTRERFLSLARGRRDQVRMFLMDKGTLASIGNAYADEILFAAGLHPKTFMRQLAPEDLERLFVSINEVLAHAIAEIDRRNEPIEIKVRDFLAVRGRDGKPCPRCGTKIRAVRVGDGDSCFCPSCQPTTRKLFVDFARLPAEKDVVASALTPRSPPAAGEKAPPRRRSPRSASRRPPPSGS
jgi:formamidopyrimidine-DNA glycosylase